MRAIAGPVSGRAARVRRASGMDTARYVPSGGRGGVAVRAAGLSLLVGLRVEWPGGSSGRGPIIVSRTGA